MAQLGGGKRTIAGLVVYDRLLIQRRDLIKKVLFRFGNGKAFRDTFHGPVQISVLYLNAAHYEKGAGKI